VSATDTTDVWTIGNNLNS